MKKKLLTILATLAILGSIVCFLDILLYVWIAIQMHLYGRFEGLRFSNIDLIRGFSIFLIVDLLLLFSGRRLEKYAVGQHPYRPGSNRPPSPMP